MLGSSLTMGLLIIIVAFVAQVRVEMFSSRKLSLGLIQAIIRQQLFPPIDCFRIDVSLESLQGMCWLVSLFFLPQSARVEMTCRNVNRDLLMSMDSLASRPSAPVSPILYEPAKSTSSILLLKILVGCECSKLQILMVRMEWLLELFMLSLWLELTLFLSPNTKCLISSSVFLHSQTKRFSTLNCQFLFQRSFSPTPDLKEMGLSRSNTFSLQICRNETETTKVFSLCLEMLSNNSPMALGMMPSRALLQGSSLPCMVKVLPEPVCPQAKMVLWYPSSALLTSLVIQQLLQMSSWEFCSSRTWSNWKAFLVVRLPSLQVQRTSLLFLSTLRVEFSQPRQISVSRKGLTLTATFILVVSIENVYRVYWQVIAQNQDYQLFHQQHYRHYLQSSLNTSLITPLITSSITSSITSVVHPTSIKTPPKTRTG